MGVRHQHRVDLTHVIGKRLRAQFSSGIDEDGTPVVADKGRSASAAVSGVSRAANVAVAADHRNAIGGPGAEEGDLRHTRASIARGSRLTGRAVTGEPAKDGPACRSFRRLRTRSLARSAPLPLSG